MMRRQNRRKRENKAQLPRMISRQQQSKCERSIRSLSKDHKKDRLILKRFLIKTSKGEVPRAGYTRLAKALIFDDNMEFKFAYHIKKLADQ